MLSTCSLTETEERLDTHSIIGTIRCMMQGPLELHLTFLLHYRDSGKAASLVPSDAWCRAPYSYILLFPYITETEERLEAHCINCTIRCYTTTFYILFLQRLRKGFKATASCGLQMLGTDPPMYCNYILYFVLSQRLRKGLKPTASWGPADAQYRAQYSYPNQEEVCMAPLVCLKGSQRQYQVNRETLDLQEKIPC